MTEYTTHKTVSMTAEDWRNVGNEAVENALGWLHQEGTHSRAGALLQAADQLRAAGTFFGRANMMELAGNDADTTTVELLEPVPVR